MALDAAALLHDARTRAGLSQRELAERARTAQSVVARIESGATSPTWDTLTRLLATAGFTLDATLQPTSRGLSHITSHHSIPNTSSPRWRDTRSGTS